MVWYFIGNETVRFYPRLGWSVVSNSFGSGEGEKKDWEECLKWEASAQAYIWYYAKTLGNSEKLIT